MKPEQSPATPAETRRARASEEIGELQLELDSLHTECETLKRGIELKRDMIEWLEAGTPHLGRNEHSRSHRLVEAMRDGKVLNAPGELSEAVPLAFKASQVFVVRHDWAAALGSAIEEAGGGDSLALPYESCIFEFIINGRCVVIWAFRTPAASAFGKPIQAAPFVEFKEGWYCGGVGEVAQGSPFHFAWMQIVAICVALDAEVATRTVVRAPAALNRKRERSGKPPLKDFHIVDLSRRGSRIAGPGTGSHRSPRLHFRRGHWRHYESHNAWIRWTLVGNPDLGFVDKEYRL